MSLPDPSAETVAEREPVNLVVAGVYPNYAAGLEHSLVVLAMERPCWLVEEADGFRLLVEPVGSAEVGEQLAIFDRESLHWPPPPLVDHLPTRRMVFGPALVWAMIVLVVFWAQGRSPGLTVGGEMDAAAVFERGEWWRLGTALFLHADAAHVISNLMAGVFVFAALLGTMGRWRGWVLLAAASVAGNLAVAAANYPAPYRSLGASTAVFAALGLLTGRAIRVVLRADHPHRWRTLFVPLAAGLTVLALYGAGGLNVDLGAHLTGFLAGLGLGFAVTGAREENSPT